MKKMIRLLCLMVVIFSQSGCMTVVATNLRLHGERTGAYFGTRGEAEFVRDAWLGQGLCNSGPNRWVAGLAALDLPFTIVSDTVYLPVDLTILRPRSKRGSEQQEGTNQASQVTARKLAEPER